MDNIPTPFKENVIDYITRVPVFRERIYKGESRFDSELISKLSQPRDEFGKCINPISYYNIIRDHSNFEKKFVEDGILYKSGTISISIQLKPYLKGAIRFHDKDGLFQRLFQDDRDFVEILDDNFQDDIPVLIDEAELTQCNEVILTWHHCHYHDLFYEKLSGYFLIPISKFQWEYTLNGPAQVYTEAIELLRFFKVL